MLRTPRTAAVLVLSLAFALCACAASAPPMEPGTLKARVAGRARVQLREFRGDIVELSVWNDGSEPLVVDRDAIVLVTPRGTRRRVPGGHERTPSVAAGQARDVNVKFDWSDLSSGDLLQIRFDHALSVRGEDVPMPPIELRVK